MFSFSLSVCSYCCVYLLCPILCGGHAFIYLVVPVLHIGTHSRPSCRDNVSISAGVYARVSEMAKMDAGPHNVGAAP